MITKKHEIATVMKNIYFLFFFGCILVTSIKAEDEIDLFGDTLSKSTRSLITPIQAFNIGQSIEVDFNSTVGTEVVSIYDEMGNAVYQQSLNASAGEQLLIDISNWEAGSYYISFTNTSGGCIYGDFDIVR